MSNQITNQPKVNLAYKFTYDGVSRIVDNVTLEGDSQQIIGFEVRKGGKFSYHIKRYSLTKITDLTLIDPPKRVGPKIGRPVGEWVGNGRRD